MTILTPITPVPPSLVTTQHLIELSVTVHWLAAPGAHRLAMIPRWVGFRKNPQFNTIDIVGIVSSAAFYDSGHLGVPIAEARATYLSLRSQGWEKRTPEDARLFGVSIASLRRVIFFNLGLYPDK